MEQVLAKVIPIMILITAGFIMKQRSFVTQEVVNGIKKLIVNLALPSVLFLSFITLEMQKETIGLTIVMILMLLTLNLWGRLLNNIKWIHNPILPFVLSAVTFGLLGTALYEAAFGIERLGDISILGMGHELFMWFIYVNLLKRDFSNEKVTLTSFLNGFKSPLLISVMAGIIINLLGWAHYIEEVAILKGFHQTIKYLSQMGTPLILMMVGYGLELNKKYIKRTVLYVLIRRVSLIGIGYLFKFLILSRFIEMSVQFNYAFFTFLILPPPFLLSIFIETHGDGIDQKTRDNIILANNIVVLDTVVCITTFIIFIFIININ